MSMTNFRAVDMPGAKKPAAVEKPVEKPVEKVPVKAAVKKIVVPKAKPAAAVKGE